MITNNGRVNVNHLRNPGHIWSRNCGKISNRGWADQRRQLDKMDIEDLSRFDTSSLFKTDLVIVGGGRAGLTSPSNRRRSNGREGNLGIAVRRQCAIRDCSRSAPEQESDWKLVWTE
jgi:hypothetical protein